MLGGCSNGNEDLKEFMDNAAKNIEGKIPPAPILTPYKKVVFQNAGNIMNPFKARMMEFKNGGINAPDLARPKEPLEDYALDSLKMMGVLVKNKIPYALVLSSSGKLFHIRAGQYIGQNYGRVNSVNEDGVQLEELVQDANGVWITNTLTVDMVKR